MNRDWKIYEDKHIYIENINTRYWEIGSGNEYLLFIHGFGGAVEEWIFNIPSFEDKFHIFALDLPGQGRTDKPDLSYSYDFYADFVYKFLNQLNIKITALIGHSLGGMIALLFSIKYSGKINKMVLISPACKKDYGIVFRLPTIPFIGEILMKPPSSHEDVRKSFLNLTYGKFEMPSEVIKRAYEIYKSSGYIHACLRFFRNYLNIFGLTNTGKLFFKNFENSLKHVKNPVLLFWGRNDKVIPLRYGEYLRKRITGFQYYEIENCGHNPHWEKSEEFNHNVNLFLMPEKV